MTDEVKLPDPYDFGSTSLRQWILKKMKNDHEKLMQYFDNKQYTKDLSLIKDHQDQDADAIPLLSLLQKLQINPRIKIEGVEEQKVLNKCSYTNDSGSVIPVSLELLESVKQYHGDLDGVEYIDGDIVTKIDD